MKHRLKAAANNRATALSALIAVLGIVVLGLPVLGIADLNVAVASDLRSDARAPTVEVAASESGSRFLPLGVGKSVVIDLPRDVKDILVADPKVANAVVRSSRRVYVIGSAIGQTNIFLFDVDGRQIAGFDIAVTRDLNGVRAALKQLFPNSDIHIEGVGDGVVLAGTVNSQLESQQAFDLAVRLVGDGTKVVNSISVKGRDQVMLKVTVAEVQREVIKQLGVNLNGTAGQGTAVVNFSNINPFSSFGQALTSSGVALQTSNGTTATLQAMERAGVIRTLAEPTLTAISGENASFIAGGEFPIPAGLSCSTTTVPPICQQSIDYKKFGVGLTFTPVVLSEGRISLRVMTEVSDLSSDNALTITLANTNNTQTIPSIRVRRAETTLEIPSGGSLALAGMIQEQTKHAINGFPGLMQLPVLGPLFRSRDYLNNQTELMILVTPYVVRAVAEKDLSRPDDGFADASDPSANLLGRFNHIYGVPGKVDPQTTYRGSYGFILD
jgi:pilus assembly protein CpaC